VKQSEIDEGDIEKIFMIKNAENINIISPKVVGAVNLDEDLIAVVGVNFTNELRLKKWWEIIGDVPDPNEALIGYYLYDRLGLALGQELELNGQVFKVSGFLNKTETQDDNVIFVGKKMD